MPTLEFVRSAGLRHGHSAAVGACDFAVLCRQVGSLGGAADLLQRYEPSHSGEFAVCFSIGGIAIQKGSKDEERGRESSGGSSWE